MTIIQTLSLDINNNHFFVKRDDLLPFSFGGNKARKAVLFFEDIKRKKSDIVVTYGSSSSNHCRIIANMAAREGLECIIISPQEAYEETANSRLVQLYGAKIIKTPLEEVSQRIDDVIEELKAKKRNPYFIQGGGHGNLGTEAYVNAYGEITEYEKENGILFDYIFLASGTGTTQAGLAVGKLCHKRAEQRIVGISIARSFPRGKNVVLESINEYLGDNRDYSNEVDFIDDYICGGYGKYNDEIIDTIREVLLLDGMALNTTYTGKAFWGMKKYIINNNIRDKNVLFINTGGLPLFFDGLEKL